jgi:hypothetical protein
VQFVSGLECDEQDPGERLDLRDHPGVSIVESEGQDVSADNFALAADSEMKRKAG